MTTTVVTNPATIADGKKFFSGLFGLVLVSIDGVCGNSVRGGVGDGEGERVGGGDSEGLIVGLGAGADDCEVVEFSACTHIPGGRLMKYPSAPRESQTFTSMRKDPVEFGVKVKFLEAGPSILSPVGCKSPIAVPM